LGDAVNNCIVETPEESGQTPGNRNALYTHLHERKFTPLLPISISLREYIPIRLILLEHRDTQIHNLVPSGDTGVAKWRLDVAKGSHLYRITKPCIKKSQVRKSSFSTQSLSAPQNHLDPDPTVARDHSFGSATLVGPFTKESATIALGTPQI
jgi:hypothetical protein